MQVSVIGPSAGHLLHDVPWTSASVLWFHVAAGMAVTQSLQLLQQEDKSLLGKDMCVWATEGQGGEGTLLTVAIRTELELDRDNIWACFFMHAWAVCSTQAEGCQLDLRTASIWAAQ